MRRLGLYLGRLPGFDKTGFDRRELIECVRVADACGYDSFWMPEAWEHDAVSILTELAGKTERIGLGTGIINVFSRSPALIAMSAATIDEITGGRFRLGLGTSGARVVEDFHGLSYSRPLTRLGETVEIVRRLLAGDRVDYAGECFKLSRFKLGFKPLREDVPVYIAALSPKSLYQLGQIADGWLPVHWPRARLGDGIAEIHRGAADAGRDAGAIEIAPFVNVVVSDDLRGARRLAAKPLAYYVGGMGEYYHDAVSRAGFATEACLIREKWQAGHPRDAIAAVTDEMIDSIAICGSIGSCVDRLDEMYRCGASLPLVPIPTRGTTVEKCRIIESLLGNE
jgi:F420-dependent oxidoreductase-like protein